MSLQRSQPERKHFFVKMTGLLINILVWSLGIALASSRSWRVWEFDSNIAPVVFIGLWDAFYFHNMNISSSLAQLRMQSSLNGSWVLSDEIRYGRDLILLANCMVFVTFIFVSKALWVHWITDAHPEFLRFYYKIAASFLFLSSISDITAVTMNFYVDFYGQTTLDFPPSFPVKKEMLVRKRFTYVFPLGITTAVLSLISATLFFYDTCSIKWSNRVNAMPTAELPHASV
ncbi:Mitochondrial-Processing Peptidase Subunit Beta [Manis pentadactyla]|nr:Mitochondrial-Processing Peptidase Subunit Beta [Manis pentadactyla]